MCWRSLPSFGPQQRPSSNLHMLRFPCTNVRGWRSERCLGPLYMHRPGCETSCPIDNCTRKGSNISPTGTQITMNSWQKFSWSPLYPQFKKGKSYTWTRWVFPLFCYLVVNPTWPLWQSCSVCGTVDTQLEYLILPPIAWFFLSMFYNALLF